MTNYSKLIFLMVFIFSSQVISQIGTTIPSNRTVDWTTVGYHNNPTDNLPKYVNSVLVAKPSNDPNINLTNITNKIIEASKKKGLTAVILQNGTYKISRSINFGVNQKNIVLKGSGNTEILFLGKPTKAANIIKIVGKSSNWENAEQIIGYSDISRNFRSSKKTNNIKVGDFIEIRVPNGNWHDSKNHKGWNPQNYLGTIVKVLKVNKSKNLFTVDHSLKTLWGLSQEDKKIPTFTKFTPIQEIGIESLKLSTDNNNNRQGYNINIAYAANCWVKDVESAYAASTHLSIGFATSIEVRNSTFHHAKDYGNPPIPEKKIISGTGYGVNIARSSNCLIENNVFYQLRHAMIIALGANRNVFGYNHSYDQFSYPVKNLADLNLHGHFPYNNLFEGNRVDRIHADQWWGSNGPNNTFIRNIVKDGAIKLEKTSNANLLGNEAKLVLIDSKSTVETYADNKSQKTWNSISKQDATLEDISYYKKSKPSFLDKKQNWPPIGPEVKSRNGIYKKESMKN